MFLLYSGKRHSKLSSVNTQTIQFPQFFELRKFAQHRTYPIFPIFWVTKIGTTPKLSMFFHFWTCKNLQNLSQHQNYQFFPVFGFAKPFITPKLSIFPIFGLAKPFIIPELSNFPHFWTCKTFHNTQTIRFSIFLDVQKFMGYGPDMQKVMAHDARDAPEKCNTQET